MAKGKKKSKGRRKGQTPAQKAASMKNLRKARAAQRRKSAPKTKRPRKAHRTAAQKAASKRNIKKAQAASRRKGRKTPRKATTHRKTPRKAARRSGQTAAQRRASLANLRKARAATRSKHRVHVPEHRPKKRSKAAKRSSGRRRGKQTMAQYRASLRNLKKARSARKRASKRHPVRSYSYHSRPKRVHVPAHMSWEYAMENPLGGVEIFVGLVTGLVGFMSADLVDRLLATHPLTDKGSKDTQGHELYADNPLTASTWRGNYANLFNPTAIAAPMSIARWGFGLGIVVVPVVIAKWVEAPVGRSALQMFGFGAAMRVVGKGLIDLVAMITKWTEFGQRYFDGELRAAALASGDGTEASLPSAGLGNVPAGTGCACANCTSGVGACCGDKADGGTTGTGATPQGTGYPSNVREVANANGGGGGGGFVPPPPPPPSLTQAEAAQGFQGLQGTPEGAMVRKRNPFNWGEAA